MKAEAHRSEFAIIDGNPAPDGIRAVSVETADGVTLRCAVSPSAKASTRGTILLLQGRNEVIEKYFETMADLNRMGFATVAFDWRGQGGSTDKDGSDTTATPSEKRRRIGHVRRFRHFLDDLDAVIHDLLLPDCRPPFAILAHSTGGLIALSASDRLTNRIERMVLSAPLVALQGFANSGAVHGLAMAFRLTGLGRLPLRPLNFKTPEATLADNTLTSDRRRFERNQRLAREHPQLFLNAPTFGWVASILRASRRLERSDVIAKLSVPTLFICAGSDEIVATEKSERLAWRMRTGSSVTLPGARHEILQEADRYREPLFAALDAFLAETLPDREETAQELPPQAAQGGVSR